MADNLIQIQLNDIIQINSPENSMFHNKTFIVIYASESKIKILDAPINLLETKQEELREYGLPIDEQGNLLDSTIESISLLSRDDNPGFAIQNNLIPETWIDITFSEEMPSIITGEITNLEEDMIEIRIYPSNKIIYIDFAYKGIPEELPIKEIRIRDKPKDVKLDVESRTSLQDSTSQPPAEEQPADKQVGVEIDPEEEPDEEPDKDPVEDPDEDPDEEDMELDQIILEGDAIQFGDELGEIYQEVNVDEDKRRFAIDDQTNDLMDDMLSRIPTIERTASLTNHFHQQINRFVELRQEFSRFDENGNANMPIYKGIMNKPLVRELKTMKNKIPWIIPTVKNKKKIYHGETNVKNLLGDKLYIPLATTEYDDMDITNSLLTNENFNENSYLSHFKSDKQNTFNHENQRYKIFFKKITDQNAPFLQTEKKELIINEIEVNEIMTVIVNNQEDYDSFVVKNMDIHKTKYLMHNYIPSLKTIRKDKLQNNYNVTITNGDTMQIMSFLMLPKNVMKYSKAYLPGSSILDKSELNTNPLFYYKLLNKNMTPNTVHINDFENKTKYEKIEFLSSITEFTMDPTIKDDDRYDKFLEYMIPRIKNLFLFSKSFLTDELSVRSIIKEMEPFFVYNSDITYKQYDEFKLFLKLQIIEYKKKYVQRSKEFKRIHARSERQTINPLVLSLNNVKHPTNEKYLDTHVYEELYGISVDKDTTCEIVKKLLIDDYQLVSHSNIFAGLDLFGMIDLETEIKSLEKEYKETKEKEQEENDCKVFVLSKKYLEYDELLEDNDKDIYFDKNYDTTIYDIIDDYSEQKKSMSAEEFKIFLIEELKKNIGLTPDKAIEDAEAMILQKRPVKEGYYAMLVDDEDEDNVNNIKFFKRLNNKWERDETMKSIYAENQNIFCNMKSNCFQINNVCSSSGLAESELKENAIQYILAEFDKKMEFTIDEITQKTKINMEKQEKTIINKKKLNQFNLLKYNNLKFMMGNNVNDIEVNKSPYENLRNLIFAHNNFVEKQGYILTFCNKYTRENIHGENIHWLYCIESNLKLVPVFMHKLASSYFSGSYDETLENICKTQGAISDDESYWVDRHSGYFIKNINYSTDMGYDEGGYAIKMTDILPEPTYNTINTTTQEVDPIAQSVNNVITAVTSNLKVFLESDREFIRNHVMSLLPKIINEEIYHKLEKYAEKKQKKIPSYELSVNKSLMMLTLSFIHISIQTIIPSVKTRHSFPGCKQSFSGFPLDGDGSQTGIQYISCIANKMSSSTSPWNGIKKIKAATIEKEIKDTLTKYILKLPTVISRLQDKQEYLSLPQENNIPYSIHFTKWLTFLPPLNRIEIPRVDNISNTFKENLRRNMKNGSKNQNDQYLELHAKARSLTMEILKFIQKIVEDKTPILTNNLLEPFLENSCCNDGNMNTYRYFVTENNSINNNNLQITMIEDILHDYRNFFTAPMILDLTNTKMPIIIFNEYNEETIYKTFIDYCNLLNDNPIPEQLKIFFTEELPELKTHKTISEKIGYLKEQGKNLTSEEFFNLLKMVSLSNSISPRISQKTTNYERLTDIFNYVNGRNDEMLPSVFMDGFISLMEDTETYFTENSDELASFKDYLYKSTISMNDEIKVFFEKYSSYSKKQINDSFLFLTNLNVWKKINENSANQDDDMTRIFTFINDFIKSTFVTFPNIIKNKNEYTNVDMPSQWNLTYTGKTSLESNILTYYKKLKKYISNETVSKIFDGFPESISVYLLILGEIQFRNGLHTNTSTQALHEFTTFDRNLCILLYKYISSSLFIECINIPDVETFVFKQGERDLTNVTTTDHALQSDELKLEELDFVEDSTNTNKQLIADYLIDCCSIFSVTKKKALNHSLQDIKNNVSKDKEKEKQFEFTDKLANMDNEERELNNLFKNHNLGDWGKGKEKGITQYDKDFFDMEVKEREKRIILERNLANNPDVTDMNLNIFAMEYEEDSHVAAEIEFDVFNLDDMPEDDDSGEMDDGGYNGGK